MVEQLTKVILTSSLLMLVGFGALVIIFGG
jgi:hypothetical protein